MAKPGKGSKPGPSSSSGSSKSPSKGSSSSSGGSKSPSKGTSSSGGGSKSPSKGTSSSSGGSKSPSKGTSGSSGSRPSSSSSGSSGSRPSSSSSGSGNRGGSSGGRGGSTLSGGVSVGENNPNSPNYRPDRYDENGNMTDRYKEEYEADENDRIMAEGGWGKGYHDKETGQTHHGSGYYDDDDPYDDYLEALKEQKEAQARELQRQIESAVNTLQGYKGTLKDQFTESASNAYVQNMLSKKNLPQQLATQGITGGMTESSNLALETAYGNAYNNLENSYNQGIKDIDRDIFNTKSQGDISKAQNVARYSQSMAEAAYQQAQMQQQAKQAYDQMLLQAQLQREQMELENQYKQQYLAQQQEYKNNSGSRTANRTTTVPSRYKETKASFDAMYSNGTTNENLMEAIQKAYQIGNINERDAIQFLTDYGLA